MGFLILQLGYQRLWGFLFLIIYIFFAFLEIFRHVSLSIIMSRRKHGRFLDKNVLHETHWIKARCLQA